MASELLPMRPEHIDEVARLFTKNFLHNNPIWKTFTLDDNQVFKFFVSDIKLHMQAQERTRKEVNPDIEFNMIYIHEGKIIAAGLNLELHEYLKMESSTGQSQTLKQFEILEGYGKKLFDSVTLQDHEKGKHIYGSFIVIDEDVGKQVKKAFRTKSLLSTYKKYVQQGFKSLILRTSNVRSEQIYQAIGAKILSEVQFQLKEQKFELKLLKLQFDNPTFSKLPGL